MNGKNKLVASVASTLALTTLVVGCGNGSGGSSSQSSSGNKSNTAASTNQSSSSGSSSSSTGLKTDPKTGLPIYKKNVSLTFWSWVPNDAARVKIFEKYYPNIKVNLKDVGAGTPEYQKFSTAVQSGSGAPDVVMLEYDMMPQFIQSGGLAPITSVVKPYESKFPKWVMNEVSFNNKVYAVPEDTGPLGLYYQKSIFDANNMQIPKTWAQYKTEALSFHKHHPNQYYSWFATNDGQWELGLLWAAGVDPFQPTSGGGWKVSLNSPQSLKVFQYWGDLIKSGAVEALSDGSPGYQKELNEGKFATVVGSAWYPSEALVPYDKHLKQHDWHAAMMPQWQEGQTVDGDWGGSADAVTKQSKHPTAAAIFSWFINASKYEQEHNVQPAASGGGGLFPAYEGGFKTKAFNAPNPALGGQRANKDIFAKESTNVDPNWQWNPWASYTFQELTAEVTKAAAGKETWKQALDTAQKKIVSYAQSQGYNVKG